MPGNQKQSRLFKSYIPSPFALRLISTVHTFLYRLTSGYIGHRLDGLDILLLSSRGRRSGKRYQTPMPYFQHPKGYLLIASNAGSVKNPGWLFNLQDQPNTSIQVGPQRLSVVASSLKNGDRDEWWDRLIAIQPRFKTYQDKTERRIPIILLETIE